MTKEPRYSHDKVFKDGSAAVEKFLQTLSEKEKEECYSKTLVERFGCGKAKVIKKEKKKIKKETAIPTHLATLEMLKKSLSIESIAAERGLKVGTIISHIEKLKSLSQIDHSFLENLKCELPKNDFDIIFTELEKSEDGRLTPIYEKLEGKYSYASIRFVRLFLETGSYMDPVLLT